MHRDFVESRAVHHEGALHSEALERLRHRFQKRRIVDADHGIVGMRGVGQGAQHIKDRAHLHRAAHRARKAHRGVVELRKAKAKARGLQKVRGLGWRRADVDSKRRQNVGGAAQGRDAAVAVLGDVKPRRRSCKRRRRGDVDRLHAVAARADDLADFNAFGTGKSRGGLDHGACGAADFVGRLALHAQRGEKGRELRGLDFSGKDLIEDGAGFGRREAAAPDDGFEHFGEGGGGEIGGVHGEFP